MSILAELTRLHPNVDERLLAASSVIVRLENEAQALRKAVAFAVATLQGISQDLRSPPLPMPNAADSIDKTIALIQVMAIKSSGVLTS
jgi:hypothetical protein